MAGLLLIYRLLEFRKAIDAGMFWALVAACLGLEAVTATTTGTAYFGVAGLISPSSFGYLVDRTGSWVFPFIASIVLLLLGAVLASRLRPDLPFVESE